MISSLGRAVSIVRLIVTFVMVHVFAVHALAQNTSVLVESSHSTAQLIAEPSSVKAGNSFWVAVDFNPQDHWHTYWRNPGDSGMATIYEWSVPDYVTVSAPIYQIPVRLPVGPLQNYGYEDRSQTLFKLDIAENASVSENLDITLTVEWLVCKIECIPQLGTFDLSLPFGSGDIEPTSADFFSAARNALPELDMYGADLTVEREKSDLTIFMATEEQANVHSSDFFPESEGVIVYTELPTISRGDKGLILTFKRDAGSVEPVSSGGLLTLTYVDGSKMISEIEPKLTFVAQATAVDAASTESRAALALWQVALFALLGGLILNLMPCVFPILSLKAISLLSSGHNSPAERRMEGWAYTNGIMVSFAVVVGVLLMLRSAGAVVGWGFQLQEPMFVAFMTLVMIAVAVSLLGGITFSTGLEGAGQSLTQAKGYKGPFYTGVLATLVATPCTAPFMAPAIGYALTQSVFVIVVVFFMLALGLALPFLLLTHSQTLAKLLPKPGAWMEKVKQGMAFPMMLTAVWLIYVFSNEAGDTAALVLSALAVVFAFALWLWGQTRQMIGRGIAVLAFVLPAYAFIQVPHVQDTSDAAVSEDHEGLKTLTYSQESLNEVLNSGQGVFVYFTADWCITCKVNEQIALYRDETLNMFKRENIALMKGDWTNRNDEIAAILEQYGRAGVPLYLYFPEGSNQATVLPEVLTVGTIREYIAPTI